MDYNDLNPEEAFALLMHDKWTIFDTRDGRSYSLGHMEGAKQISDTEIKRLIVRKQRKQPVLVYCYHGNSSKDICSLLSSIGFSNVNNLSGGWLAWQNFIAEKC
jgi:thiosulfate sulfurtransferase